MQIASANFGTLASESHHEIPIYHLNLNRLRNFHFSNLFWLLSRQYISPKLRNSIRRPFSLKTSRYDRIAYTTSISHRLEQSSFLCSTKNIKIALRYCIAYIHFLKQCLDDFLIQLAFLHSKTSKIWINAWMRSNQNDGGEYFISRPVFSLLFSIETTRQRRFIFYLSHKSHFPRISHDLFSLAVSYFSINSKRQNLTEPQYIHAMGAVVLKSHVKCVFGITQH